MTANIQPVQFPTRGLAFLAESMQRYLAQKQAREQAEQRLAAAFGQPTAADGHELTMQPTQESSHA